MSGPIINITSSNEPVFHIEQQDQGPALHIQGPVEGNVPPAAVPGATDPQVQFQAVPNASSDNFAKWVMEKHPECLYDPSDPNNTGPSKIADIKAKIQTNANGGYNWQEDETLPAPTQQGDRTRPIYITIEWEMTLKDGRTLTYNEKYVPYDRNSMPTQEETADPEKMEQLFQKADIRLHLYKKIMKGPLDPKSKMYEVLKDKVENIAQNRFSYRHPLVSDLHLLSLPMATIILDGPKGSPPTQIKMGYAKAGSNPSVFEKIEERAKVSTKHSAGKEVGKGTGPAPARDPLLDADPGQILAKAQEAQRPLGELARALSQEVQKDETSFQQLNQFFLKDEDISHLPVMGGVVNAFRKLKRLLFGASVPNFKEFSKEYAHFKSQVAKTDIEALKNDLKTLKAKPKNTLTDIDKQKIQMLEQQINTLGNAQAHIDYFDKNMEKIGETLEKRKKSEEQLKAMETHLASLLSQKIDFTKLAPNVRAVLSKLQLKPQELSSAERKVVDNVLSKQEASFNGNVAAVPPLSAEEAFTVYKQVREVEGYYQAYTREKKIKIVDVLSRKVNETKNRFGSPLAVSLESSSIQVETPPPQNAIPLPESMSIDKETPPS